MLKDLKSCSITQFGCMLYFLEVLGIDYKKAIGDIEKNNNINLEKEDINKYLPHLAKALGNNSTSNKLSKKDLSKICFYINKYNLNNNG